MFVFLYPLVSANLIFVFFILFDICVCAQFLSYNHFTTTTAINSNFGRFSIFLVEEEYY